MDSSTDKEWATKYLLDPLNAPEPYQVDSPSTRFVPSPEPASQTSMKGPSSTVRPYPTPPQSASPTASSFHPSNPFAAAASSSAGPSSPHRQMAFGGYDGSNQRRSNSDDIKTRRRGSSLTERYPGDRSHQPLEVIRKESKRAHRSPHLRKSGIPGADSIDTLDDSVFGVAYHHEGPYDAALAARNNVKYPPLDALRASNEEAIRATPPEKLRDALERHRPLEGVAVIPPGMRDFSGRVMDYEEGADLMREPDAPGGAYRRWEGIQYHPDDLKGKGEPSYSIEKALKDHKNNSHRRIFSDGEFAYEMQTPVRTKANRMRSHSGNDASLYSGSIPRKPVASSSLRYADDAGEGPSSATGAHHRNSSSSSKIGEGLKKRLGSLRKKGKNVDVDA